MADQSILEKGKNLDRADVNILIIDDDQDITRTFSRILQKNGYQTDTALTGAEAIQKTACRFYDVVLIDLCLPDIKGTALLGRLGDHGGKMIKIVITGFPTLGEGDFHPDAYLLKPAKPQELLALISEKTRLM